MTSLFSKSYTSRYPFQAHTPEKRFRGLPEFHREHCVGCTACAQVCPADAIDWEDDLQADPPVRRLVLHYDRCLFCGQCQAHCIADNKGIQLSARFELAGFDRELMVEKQENELVLCEECGEAVGTRDHLRLIREKVGALSLANENTLLALQEELGLAPASKGKISPPLKRGDLFRILCPRCRRDVHLADEWNTFK